VGQTLEDGLCRKLYETKTSQPKKPRQPTTVQKVSFELEYPMKTTIRQLALLFAIFCMANAQMPSIPIYFAVTDVDVSNNESGFSNETVWPKGFSAPCNLTWEAPVGVVDHYNIYFGYQSRIYTRVVSTKSAATIQLFPIPQPPQPTPIWQKSFSYLHATNVIGLWVTNNVPLCTVTGTPSALMSFDRAGQIQWKRIQ
jgi:hypothetical protein